MADGVEGMAGEASKGANKEVLWRRVRKIKWSREEGGVRRHDEELSHCVWLDLRCLV